MFKSTPKTLALRIDSNLKSRKTLDGLWQILRNNQILSESNTSIKAWNEAYHLLAKDQFKVGDLLIMEGCAEAKLYQSKVWECRYPSYQTASGYYAVFLKGMVGYFCTEFLRKATPQELIKMKEASLKIS